ncbi:MAG: UDP-N-acetylmuramate dehydrogenase [Bryobacterales bacterium]|nr:UDP-N-acetylmuramate dehydrogenase [Bryobacterales bacterium]
MPVTTEEAIRALAALPHTQVSRNIALAGYTRFAIGGPADVLAETGDTASFMEALRLAGGSGRPVAVIGGGTNLIAADEGFPGIVLRYTANRIWAEAGRVKAEAGAELQALVDFTVERGLKGLETLTRIPGWVGAAVHGNAGAYGHSISESVARVTWTDGREIREFTNAGCRFRYRESVFKSHKSWIILSAELGLAAADPAELRQAADRIAAVRDLKFPPAMCCAGSIFKNLLLDELPAAAASRVPETVIREGKVPAGWFLEQVGAKGMAQGGIRVAAHHGNLIYNAGGGTARDLRALISELKRRVRGRFGLELEEEVQYIGMGERPA